MNDKHERTLLALQEIAVELIEATSDHNLLSLVVLRATQLLNCDGGSLFLRKGEDSLSFKVAVNQSVPVNYEKVTLPLSGTGLVCHVSNSGKSLRIDDVYDIPLDAPYQFNRSFDVESGYRTKSVLALPLSSSKGEPLGVIQLINRKNEVSEVWPSSNEKLIATMPKFTDADESLLKSFASIAAASIEKSNLYLSIQNLFEGFVHASVRAIESRDPVTSGHSERVAALTVNLAEAANRSNSWVKLELSEDQIKEVEYAALLHDFGKISVRETTLLKAKKLFEEQFLGLENRFQRFRMAAEILELRDFITQLTAANRAPNQMDLVRLEKGIARKQQEILECWQQICQLNEPTVLDENKSHILNELTHKTYPTELGEPARVLELQEVQALSIIRGSLSKEERLEIENHVTSTFNFLNRIPWTSDLRQVPTIAHAHHEKLNGTGYPRKLTAENIPVQSRMMTICDIYDALVAADRPYKKAIPVEKALDILGMEVKSGALDPSLFQLFLEAKVYEDPKFLSLNRPKRAA